VTKGRQSLPFVNAATGRTPKSHGESSHEVAIVYGTLFSPKKQKQKTMS
jgi:hypothetical protein